MTNYNHYLKLTSTSKDYSTLSHWILFNSTNIFNKTKIIQKNCVNSSISEPLTWLGLMHHALEMTNSATAVFRT